MDNDNENVTFQRMATAWSTRALSAPCHSFCACGGGSEIPNPDLPRVDGANASLKHTPSSPPPTQPLWPYTPRLIKVCFLFTVCWMCCDVRVAVEMRDWFNKGRELLAAAAAFSLKPKRGPWSGSTLSAEHRVTHGPTSRGIKSLLLFSTCQTAVQLRGQLSWIKLATLQ